MAPTTAMIPARDGVKLATDIYVPDGAGPFPVILERTTYGRHITSRSERSAADAQPATRAEFAAFFMAHGYAVAYQDCRGRWGSEGKFSKYLSEGEDGYDTCAWLVAQPWCDGRICTLGLSYAAHTQGAMGCLDPPGLVAQVIDSGGFANAWEGGIRSFGAFELKQVTWAHAQAILSPEAQADPVLKAALEAEDLRDWYARLPWKPGHSPLRHHPDYEAYLFDQWRHGAFGDYYKQVGIWMEGFYQRYSRAACVQMSSWFDIYPRGAAANFNGLRKAQRGPQRLILGPWTHGDRSVTCFGDVEFGAAAAIDSWCGDWRAYRLHFFDHVIKGTPDPEPPVRVFVMGGGSGKRNAAGKLEHGGHWIALDDWPPPRAQFTAHYLHDDGALRQSPPASTGSALSYDFDPANPVPTIGHALNRETVVRGGVYDQVETPDLLGAKPPYLPLASRPDVLVFQTEKLTKPLTVAGPVVAQLWVATDGPDTDFTAKLVDVHPPSADYPRGYAMIVTDGIMRLRYTEDRTREKMRKAGEIVKITVELLPTANLFLPGHRIRLDISSSNFPKFDVNTNTGEPEGAARRKRIAVNTVFMDGGRPSHVVLPLLPS